MEKSPCEKCKVKNCSRYKECERWKKRMRDAWAEIRRIYRRWVKKISHEFWDGGEIAVEVSCYE